MDINEFKSNYYDLINGYLKTLKKFADGYYVEGDMDDNRSIENANFKGVYIVFDENDNALYVGDAITDKFKVKDRLNGHLNGHKTNATIVNGLMETKNISRQDAIKYLENNCKFIAIPWESLEYYLIEKMNGLLNKKGN